jgi:hypothetical protein
MTQYTKKLFFYLTLVGICLLVFFEKTNAQFTPPRILKHPSQIRIEALHVLNSTYRETNLNVTPDGNYLFFMSGRGGMPWSSLRATTTYRGKVEYDGDIWYSRRIAGKWQYPRALDNSINNDKGQDEPNISPDGQTVYFQNWRDDWESSGGPYYKASLNGSNWSFPKGLGGGITQFFLDVFAQPAPFDDPTAGAATDGATMSADGRTFIVAAGKSYTGNLDLYISRKDIYGNWSYPIRLDVSTLGDERSPFLAADGKTLYFASDGYGGWGGLDILKTVINANNRHEEIVNVGAPFNTWLNDYGLTLTASGDDAFFVREGDIYYADTKNASPEFKPFAATLMLAGKIIDAKTKKALQAKIVVKDAKSGQVLVEGTSNSVTGEYTLLIPTENPSFVQEVSKVEYENFSKPFNTQIKTGLNKVDSNVELAKPEPIIATKPPEIKKEVLDAAADYGIEKSPLRR